MTEYKDDDGTHFELVYTEKGEKQFRAYELPIVGLVTKDTRRWFVESKGFVEVPPESATLFFTLPDFDKAYKAFIEKRLTEWGVRMGIEVNNE